MLILKCNLMNKIVLLKISLLKISLKAKRLVYIGGSQWHFWWNGHWSLFFRFVLSMSSVYSLKIWLKAHIGSFNLSTIPTIAKWRSRLSSAKSLCSHFVFYCSCRQIILLINNCRALFGTFSCLVSVEITN